MKVPPKRKGNPELLTEIRGVCCCASMKVPPKRKGNFVAVDEDDLTGLPQ